MKHNVLGAAIGAALLRSNLERKLHCPDDLIVWPCGTQCFRSEVAEYTHMSDDYEVVSFGSVRYNQLVNS